MANIDRFFDMGEYHETELPERLWNRRPENREFLPVGAKVILKNSETEVTVLEKLSIENGTVYDYKGRFTEEGKDYLVFFNENAIEKVIIK